jgi:hypothetical protein
MDSARRLGFLGGGPAGAPTRLTSGVGIAQDGVA